MTRAFIDLYVYITKVPSGKNLLILSVGSNRIAFPGFAWENILILEDKNFFGISHGTLLSSQNEVALEDPWLSLVHLKTITQGMLPADISESTKFLATEFFSPTEWMNDNFIYARWKRSVWQRKLINNSQKLFYIFAVWEYRSENHLWELLLKRPKEFDVSIEEERHCNWRYASGNQFFVLGALIFSSRWENSNSVFLGQTNYRDKLGRDY